MGVHHIFVFFTLILVPHEALASATLNVTTIEVYPFLTHKNGEYQGFIPDLMEAVARKTGISYKFSLVKDGKFGTVQPDGSADGMLGELIRKEADIAAAPLTITSTRENSVDFTKPFMSTGIVPYIKPVPAPSPNKFLLVIAPFTVGVWAMLDLSLIICVLGLYLINRYNPREWASAAKREKATPEEGSTFSFINILWFLLSVLTWQGYPRAPRSIGGKTLAVSWMYLTCLFLILYTVSLIDHLPNRQGKGETVLPVRNLNKAVVDGNFQFYALGGGTTFEFFKRSRIPVYKEIFSKLVTVRGMDEGVEKALQGGIFMAERTMMDAKLQQKPCPLLVPLGGALDAKGYGLATPKGSNLRDRLSRALLTLQEDGELQLLVNKWWHDKNMCMDKSTPKMSQNDLPKAPAPIDIEWFAGYLIYFLLGIILSVIASVAETFYFRRKQAGKPKADAEAPLQETA